jgi:hypothetical protein
MAPADTAAPPVDTGALAPGRQRLAASGATAAVVAAWQALQALPEAAARDIWAVLGPMLDAPRSPEVAERFRNYCRVHELVPAIAGRMFEELRGVVQRAAAAGVAPGAFAADLAALDPGTTDRGAGQVLVAGYAKALPVLRRRILVETLSDHGAVLTGIDWRLDRVAASNHGADIEAAVLLVTLRYRENGRDERLSLQLTPDGIRQLKELAARIK